MTISTPQGDVRLRQPSPARLRALRSQLPLGAVAYAKPVDGAHYGIVMKCGDDEAWAVKQQPPDTPAENFANDWMVNNLLLALSIKGYLDFGFSGCLMPCVYARRKGQVVEVGIAYFGSPSSAGIEANEFEFNGGVDHRFGHGFGTMLTHFIKELQQASKSSPLTLQPCIGLEDRPRSMLETLGFGFLVHGPDVFCLKTKVSEQDPVWTVLRSTGIKEVYHLPSVPAEITAEQLPIAKPNPTE